MTLKENWHPQRSGGAVSGVSISAAGFVFLSSAAPCLAFTADARVQSRDVAPSGAAHQSCALSL